MPKAPRCLTKTSDFSNLEEEIFQKSQQGNRVRKSATLNARIPLSFPESTTGGFLFSLSLSRAHTETYCSMNIVHGALRYQEVDVPLCFIIQVEVDLYTEA